MGGDDAQAHRQPHAHAALFFSIERLKYAGNLVGWNTGPLVLHAHLHRAPLREHLDRHNALSAAGLDGVLHEVAHHLADAGLVATGLAGDLGILLADGQLWAVVVLHAHPRAYFARELPQIDGGPLQLRLACEIEEPADDLVQMVRFAHGNPGKPRRNGRVLRVMAQLFHGAANAGQGVAYLVGESGGHFPQHGQPVLLLQLLPHARNLGQVGEGSDDARDPPALIAEAAGGEAQQHGVAVGPFCVKLVTAEMLVGTKRGGERALRSGGRPEHAIHMAADRVAFHQPEDVAGGPIDRPHNPLGVGNHETAVHVVEDVALELLQPA